MPSSTASTTTSPSSPPSSSPSTSQPSTRRKRVSAEHTLTRVRENQRRHRARQKATLSSLEAALAAARAETETARAETEVARAETVAARVHTQALEDRLVAVEAALVDARARIEEGRVLVEALRAERDVAEAFACWDLSRHFGGEGVGMGFVGGEVLEASEVLAADVGVVAADVPLVEGPPPCCADTASTSMSTSTAMALSAAADGIPDISHDAAPSPSSAAPSAECTTCATRPPPSPSESTTLCAQAFVLIAQRNVRNLDPALIRLWLSRGYRRAVREGEGCRVEDKTLEGLLEYISGV
ncbi:hypothetical protein C7974DRAFT_373814 [Boeremia exigua]|uniref:uncharacterized protein n=1 Tax=Boeremia exigua TaxID=749465 RepID=UPI001E8E186F|nr:uncharacterized protein C7974DRAFT_373814 [Boeremia exigua]KAH6639594.1 hypothetical protein C7974DRAFT_373814 [Boeremia exigua]